MFTVGVYCNSLEELDLSGVAVTLTSIQLLCERLPGIKVDWITYYVQTVVPSVFLVAEDEGMS